MVVPTALVSACTEVGGAGYVGKRYTPLTQLVWTDLRRGEAPCIDNQVTGFSSASALLHLGIACSKSVPPDSSAFLERSQNRPVGRKLGAFRASKLTRKSHRFPKAAPRQKQERKRCASGRSRPMTHRHSSIHVHSLQLMLNTPSCDVWVTHWQVVKDSCWHSALCIWPRRSALHDRQASGGITPPYLQRYSQQGGKAVRVRLRHL